MEGPTLSVLILACTNFRDVLEFFIQCAKINIHEINHNPQFSKISTAEKNVKFSKIDIEKGAQLKQTKRFSHRNQTLLINGNGTIFYSLLLIIIGLKKSSYICTLYCCCCCGFVSGWYIFLSGRSSQVFRNRMKERAKDFIMFWLYILPFLH